MTHPDQAMADGLADEPERVTPEVVDVDTSRAKPDEGEEVPTEDNVTRLPVRREVAEHAVLGTLVPLQEELRGVAQLAVTLATAGVVPKALKDQPANVLAVILTGRELGVAPMTAIRMFHVIDGAVTVAPKVRMAMVRQQGLGRLYRHQPPKPVAWDDETGEATRWQLCPCGIDSALGIEGDADCATWHGERNDTPGIVFSSTYTAAMAGSVEVRVWEGSGNNRSSRVGSLLDKDNWKNYRERMLSWRALGYLLDDAFSEVGTGLYSPDELGAVTDEDGEPIIDVTGTEVLVPADTSPAAMARARQNSNPRDDPNPPANPGTIEQFKVRIAKLSRYTGATDALKDLWKAPGDDGEPKLPPIDKLLYRQCPVASAMIDSIERRADKGEFGDPITDEGILAEIRGEDPPGVAPVEGATPESPDSGHVDAGGDEEGSVGEAGTDDDSEPSTATEGLDVSGLPTGKTAADDLKWCVKAPPDLIETVGAEVAAVPLPEVVSRLKAVDLSSAGNEASKRARLAARIVRQRMERLAGQ